MFLAVFAQIPDAPDGWSDFDSRAVVAFTAVSLVAGAGALIWYLVKSNKETADKFVDKLQATDSVIGSMASAILKATDRLESLTKESDKQGRMTRSLIRKSHEQTKEHTDTLHAVHKLLSGMAETRGQKGE